MSLKKSISFFLILLCVEVSLVAQTQIWGPDKTLSLPAGTDSLFLDSLPVLSSQVHFTNMQGEPITLKYQLHTVPVSFILLDTVLTAPVLVDFRVLDLPVNKSYYNKDTSLIIPEITNLTKPNYEASSSPNAIELFSGLNSSGSISRGVLVGNNQDAVLNSNLNLQLSGDLGQGTQIRASITDNNLPIQADGYTQTLQEFDKVYIELENPDFGMLRAGDYNITQTQNPFLRFDKRISGAGIFSKIPVQSGEIPIELQAGISRGKFSRNQFMGIEGNQGPYKLKGNNNEQFIIIISGSERVYIDGVLMKRGQTNDYVIDYNAGEITFTALQPITKERRIIVEFQYAEQNYLRTVVYAESGFQNNNFKTTVQFFNEQDSKNQSLVQDYTDEEKQQIANAGDDPTKAQVSSIQPLAFNSSLVMYELKDSLGIDSILVYSNDSSEQLYIASFAYVGDGNGDYVQSSNIANGRVFEWRAPIAGVPQGNYAPIKQLQAPAKLQVISVQTGGQINENHGIKAVAAVSQNDINTLSDIDDQNDYGAAFTLAYDWKKKTKQGDLKTELSYDYNDDNYRSVERLRNVEFGRDWNISPFYQKEVHLAGLDLSLGRKKSAFGYASQMLQLKDYQGFKNRISGMVKTDKDFAKINLSLLNTKDSLSQSVFFREKVSYTHFIQPKLWVGVRSEGEWNKRDFLANDSIEDGSYNFLQYQGFVGFGDSTANFTELSFLERWDDTALMGKFTNYSKAMVYGLKSQYKTTINSTLGVHVNYRMLKRNIPTEEPTERTINTRLSYIQRLAKNSIISSTFYETGSGNEPKRSYFYLEVPAGTGLYTYTDYNGNGIKELDEFEIAPTPDLATYIRVYQQSNEYIRTNLLKLGQNLSINAPSSWKSQKDIRAILHRFSMLLNFQMDRKTLLTGNGNRINPFEKVEYDSLIVGLNNNFRGTLFFNRSLSVFGADYTYRQTDNRNLLSFGVEQLAVKENTLNLRLNPVEPLLFKIKGLLAEKQNSSSNFTSRNFLIDKLENVYSLSYQPKSSLVITGRYEWKNELSNGDTDNKLKAKTVGLDIGINRAEKLSAQIVLNYIVNDFTGVQNSPSGYEMLQALQPGKNGTWTFTLQKTIKKNILLSFNYNGRVSSTIKPIHTGNIEIKAFF